jgi:hypothetical protein
MSLSINEFQFNQTYLENETYYSYSIFTTNTSGDLEKLDMTFFTNMSFVAPELLIGNNVTINSVFPIQNIFTTLLTLCILFFYFVL